MNLKYIKAIPFFDKERGSAEYYNYIKRNNMSDINKDVTSDASYYAYFSADFIKLFFHDLQGISISRGEYLITDSENNEMNIIVDSINKEEKYIQCKRYRRDFSKLKEGYIKLECIADYSKLPDLKKLKKLDHFEEFPSFHIADMRILDKKEDYIHLHFSGGFSSPIVANVKLYGNLLEESNMEDNINPYEYFGYIQKRVDTIGHVQLLTTDKGFGIKIYAHSYTQKGHLNTLVIYSSKIDLDFSRE